MRTDRDHSRTAFNLDRTMSRIFSMSRPGIMLGIVGDETPTASKISYGLHASPDVQLQSPVELEEDDIWDQGVDEAADENMCWVLSKDNEGKVQDFAGLSKSKSDVIDQLRLPLRNLEKGASINGVSGIHHFKVEGGGFRSIVEIHSSNCKNAGLCVPAPSWMIPQVAKGAPQMPALCQSAPVFLSAWPPSLGALGGNPKKIDRQRYDSDEDDDKDADDGLPPHELLAKEDAKNQRSSFSVCEGIGRTLKGRDLSRVRDTVWRQIGFAD